MSGYDKVKYPKPKRPKTKLASDTAIGRHLSRARTSECASPAPQQYSDSLAAEGLFSMKRGCSEQSFSATRNRLTTFFRPCS